MLHRIYRYTGNSALLNTLVGLTVKVVSTYGMGHVQWWQSIVRKTKNFGNPYGRDSMGPKLTELAWTAVLFKRLYWILDVFIHSPMTVIHLGGDLLETFWRPFAQPTMKVLSGDQRNSSGDKHHQNENYTCHLLISSL